MAKRAALEKSEIKDLSKFSKCQIVNSKKYSNRRDLLTALLEQDKEYSFSDVEEIMNKFKEKKVI
jgi:hypothetical protein